MSSSDGDLRTPAWAYVAVSAVIGGVAVLILLAMGRTPWCRCDSIKLSIADA